MTPNFIGKMSLVTSAATSESNLNGLLDHRWMALCCLRFLL